MPDLNFRVESAAPERFAAAPMLRFALRVAEAVPPGARPTPIHAVALRCQVRIEPARRRYEDGERERLLDLFGTPERWGQTVRPMLWAHVSAVFSPFEGTGEADLLLPCNSDFSLAATRYFAALGGGEVPLVFLFSGTVFYEADDGALQVGQIPWDKEAEFRLPATTWHEMMDLYYPNTSWLGVPRDLFERLDRFRRLAGHPTWEHALERLLDAAGEPVSP